MAILLVKLHKGQSPCRSGFAHVVQYQACRDLCEVRQGLGEVAQHVSIADGVLLREKAQVVGAGQRAAVDLLRLLLAPLQRQAFCEPERAGQKGSLGFIEPVGAVVAQQQSFASEARMDGVGGAHHARVARVDVAEMWQQQQGGIEVWLVKGLHEVACLRVVASAVDLVADGLGRLAPACLRSLQAMPRGELQASIDGTQHMTLECTKCWGLSRNSQMP